MERKTTHRSLMQQISGGKVVGYYYICSCGYTAPDYKGDDMVYCPQCGRIYEDKADDSMNEQINAQDVGDNMNNEQVNKSEMSECVNEQVSTFEFQVRKGAMLEGVRWAMENYPLVMGVIYNELDEDGLAESINAMRILDAHCSQKVLDEEMEMEELEEMRVNSTIHAYRFYKNVLRANEDVEWEDFFLPPTIELENKYQLKEELKEELKKLNIKYDTELDICSFDIEDNMTIREVKEVRNKGDEIIKKMTGKEVSHYDDSFLCIVFDFCL